MRIGVAAPEADASAKAIIERAGAASVGMKTFYLESQTTLSKGIDGQEKEHITTKVWCTRPDRVLITRQWGDIAVAAYVNGKSLTVYNASPRNDYFNSELKVPVCEMLPQFQFMTPTVARLLFSGNPAKDVLDNCPNLTYAGNAVVSGIPCYLLISKSEAADASIYIDANGHLRSMKLVGRAGTNIAGVGAETVYTIVPNQPIPESTYNFIPPPGAKVSPMKK